MASLPNTAQRRIGQIQHGYRRTTRGVVIHVMDGTTEGSISWWKRRGNRIGAHVCISNRRAVQTADLNSVCWHVPGGNYSYIGIEHDGTGRDSRVRWLLRRTQRKLSANRTAWILYHYRCGWPVWGKNVRTHASFGTTHPNCPGGRFPKDLYMAAVKRAYKKQVASRGRLWA